MTLHTTVVGCGAVAQRLYRKPLQQLEKRGLLRVIALVDPVPEHADALGAFFPRAKVCKQVQDALDGSTSALTLILSPAHLHGSQAIEALQHDNHVLCEKPMAANEDECARMNIVAAERKRVLAIGMIRRFFPAYAQFRQLLRDQSLGAVHSFEYREGHKFEWDVTTPAAFRPRREGGTGVLFDIGPHVVDYLDWTFGNLEVLAYRDDALGGIESNMSMDISALNGRGSVHLSWDHPQTNELRVACADGEAILRVDCFDQLAVNRSGTFQPQEISVSFPADTKPTSGQRLAPRSYSEAIYCQIVQVLRAIQLDEAPAVNGDAGRRSISVLESALSMAAPLGAPWLNSTQQTAFERLHWRRTA